VSTPPDRTAKVRRVSEKTASSYDKQIAFFEKIWFGGGREWLGARAQGRILEVGIGTGLNLRHYPADATVTGIELSPAMLAIARQRAADLGRDVDLRTGDAEHLPFDEAAFDTVVCALSLCTIPDPAAAIGEMKRVLVPGGRFVALEHVRSPRRVIRAGQRLLEPLALRFEDDHLTREPLEHLRAEGFEVERLERAKLGIVERLAARKPSAAA